MSIWRRLWSEGEADLARRALTTPEDALSRKVLLGMTRLKWAEKIARDFVRPLPCKGSYQCLPAHDREDKIVLIRAATIVY